MIYRSPAGLGTDGYHLSGGTAGNGSDRCSNPAGPGVKRTPGSRSIAAMSLQVAAIGFLTFRTTLCIMMSHDEQDSGTDGDYGYGYPYRNTALGCARPGRERQ